MTTREYKWWEARLRRFVWWLDTKLERYSEKQFEKIEKRENKG